MPFARKTISERIDAVERSRAYSTRRKAQAALGIPESTLRYWETMMPVYLSENRTLKSISKGHLCSRNIPDDLGARLIEHIESERAQHQGKLWILPLLTIVVTVFGLREFVVNCRPELESKQTNAVEASIRRFLRRQRFSQRFIYANWLES